MLVEAARAVLLATDGASLDVIIAPQN